MKPLIEYDLKVPPLVAATFPNAEKDRAYPKFDFEGVIVRDQLRVLYRLLDSFKICPEDEKIILHIENSTELTDERFKEIMTAAGSRELEVKLINCSNMTEKSIQFLQESNVRLTALVLIANENIREIQTSIRKKERNFPNLQLLQLENMSALHTIKLRIPHIKTVIMQNLPDLTECQFFGPLRQLERIDISEEIRDKITASSQQLTFFVPSTSSASGLPLSPHP